MQTTSEAEMDLVLEQLRRGKSPSDVKALLNQGGALGVVVSEGVFEEGSAKLPAAYNLATGISEVFQSSTQYTIVYTEEFLPAGVKDYEEVEGAVLSDYQAQLETIWMEELESRYPAKINKRAFRKLKRSLKAE